MTEHPEFFTTKPDGTIAYAENPPKKYQDIYPINFDNDPAGIYAEARRVLQVWIDAGVKVFRVDNRTPRPSTSGTGSSGTSRRATPTCSSSPRRSPSRR